MATSFLSSADVSAIRISAEGVFWDECAVLKRAGADDTGGYSHQQETFGNHDGDHPELEIATPCKLSLDNPSESPGFDETGRQTGRILFPISMLGQVARTDRVRVTLRFGENAGDLEFAIVGEPVIGVLGVSAGVELIPGQV